MSKRVLITGCSSGIGRSLASTLAARDYEVIATGLDTASLADLEVSQKLVLDVTSASSAHEAVAAAGRIDILVNNAGLGLWAPVEAVPEPVARLVFETNFFGPSRLINEVLPQMRERGDGMIIQIGSLAGRSANPLLGHYSSSKHALSALSAALRIELAPLGIKVAVVELGPVETSLPQNRPKPDTIAAYDGITAHFTAKLSGARTSALTADDAARGIADVIDAGAPQLNAHINQATRDESARRLAETTTEWENRLLGDL